MTRRSGCSFADGRSAEGCDEGAGRGVGDAAAEGAGMGFEAHCGRTWLFAQHGASLAGCGRLAGVFLAVAVEEAGRIV